MAKGLNIVLKKMKKSLSVILCVLTLTAAPVYAAKSGGASGTPEPSAKSAVSSAADSYEHYTENSGLNYAVKALPLSLEKFTPENTNASFADGVIDWADGKGSIAFSADITAPALYSLKSYGSTKPRV